MFKIKTLFFVILSMLSFSCRSYAQSWQWAKNAGGAGMDYAYVTAVDTAGNSYVTGVFQSSTLSFGSTTLTSVGEYDIFLAKYDFAGTLLWAKSFGGPQAEWSVALAVDIFGNVYLSGYYYSSTFSFGNTTLVNGGANDLFIAKFDENGNPLWATSSPGAGFEAASCMETDKDGNLYVGGGYGGGSISFGSTTFSGSSGSDLFLVKYDVNGNVVWAKTAGSWHNDAAKAIAVDSIGNVYFAGGFHGTSISFDNITLQNANQSISYLDMFLTKFDPNGNVLWAKSGGGIYGDIANGLAIDAEGNVYVAGDFDSPSMSIGSSTINNVDPVNGNTDIFVVKYTMDGVMTWVKSGGGAERDYLLDIATDALGNTYITGGFESTTLNIGSTTATTNGQYDIFLSQLDAAGEAVWIKTAGGSADEFPYSIAVGNEGDIYVAGRYESPSISFDSNVLTNAGSGDIFIAKIDNPTAAELIFLTNRYSPITISLVPNPASTEIEIKTKEKLPLSYTILNSFGQEVARQRLLSNERKITVSDLHAGSYFLILNTQTSKFVGKFVKL